MWSTHSVSRKWSRKAIFLYFCQRLFKAHEVQDEKQLDIDSGQYHTFLGSFEQKESIQAPIIYDIDSDIWYIARYQLDHDSHVWDIDREYTRLLWSAYQEYVQTIASRIDPFTTKFRYADMDTAKQAILLLGIMEHDIVHTDAHVIINECVELAKTYEDITTSKLINAILHRALECSNPKTTTSNVPKTTDL